MIFINNEYEPLRYSWDMEIAANRNWDKGRAYMFLFQGESPYGNDRDGFIEYLDSDRYAEAETKLRNVAIYSPVVEKEKD